MGLRTSARVRTIRHHADIAAILLFWPNNVDRMNVDQMNKLLLKDEAYQAIKKVMFESSADDTYSERQLAAQLGFGLASIRSALERLRNEGLVIVGPHLGVRLPELSIENISDFYELRSVLETHVVANLASRSYELSFVEIESIISEQRNCVSRQNASLYYQLDTQFHLALAKIYGNAEITRALESLRDRMHRLSSRLHSGHPERLKQNFEQHLSIFKSIRTGDVQEAQVQLQQHLYRARDLVLDPRLRRRP